MPQIFPTNVLIYSPLEQFNVISLVKLVFIPKDISDFSPTFDFSITNATLYFFLAILIFIEMFEFGLIKATILPNRFQTICEQSYLFIVIYYKATIPVN